ncbi:RDD family protein [Paraburkholderia sp. EG287B]|uniref:RDD family protein n=1 Tax=unclassified Paraburkholderia TaxID=2615204 RepID=UPI0034D258A7
MLGTSRPRTDAIVSESAQAAALPSAAVFPVEPAPVSIRRRLAAFVYESVLLFGVVFAAGLAFSLVLQQRNGYTHHNAMAAWIIFVVGAYFVGFWHKGGQTLPMKTWRLRVVGPDGGPPTLARATLRYLAAWLWFLPPLVLHSPLELSIPHTLALVACWFVTWAASARFSHDRQFLHDRIAGTRIVAIAPQGAKA